MSQNPYESPATPPSPPNGKHYLVKLLLRALIVIPICAGALILGYIAGGSLYFRTHTPPRQPLVLIAYAFGGALLSIMLAIRFTRWLIARLGL